MSDPEQGPEGRDDERESKDGLAIAELVKRSLGTPPASKDAPDILLGVQRKLRQRSRGKFYGDGWSTANTRMSYILVSLIMLVILAVAYFALGPVSVLPR
jgi:hypothetical protein